MLGLVFAVIAWYWWYAGVLLSSGVLGALLGTALAAAFGIDDGFGRFAFGLVGFIALMSVTYILNLPIYLVMVNTATAGASVVVAGVLLMFNQLDRIDLGDGASAAIVDLSWWWVLTWFALAAAGVGRQLMTVDSVRFPDERWAHA